MESMMINGNSNRTSRYPALLLGAALMFVTGMARTGEMDVSPSHVSPSHAAFLENLSAQCGQAFPGRLRVTDDLPGDLPDTDHLLVHFRSCNADEILIPFHAEDNNADAGWDRSRTWFVTVVDQGLELRHDHREADGSESGRTWYGGYSIGQGSASRQDFHSPERTWAARMPVGWRIEIHPGEVYRYGTIANDEFTWMVEFDLSRPVPVAEIPRVWGHDVPPTRIPGPP